MQRVGIEAGFAAQRVVERDDDEEDHPEEEGGDRAEEELQQRPHPQHDEQQQVDHRPDQHRVPEHVRDLGDDAGQPRLPRLGEVLKGGEGLGVHDLLPARRRLEAREPLAHRVGAVVAAVQELALAVPPRTCGSSP